MSNTNVILLVILFFAIIYIIWYLRRISQRIEFEDDLRFIELNMPYWVVNQKNFHIFKHMFIKCYRHNFNKERVSVAHHEFEKLYGQYLEPMEEFAKPEKIKTISKN